MISKQLYEAQLQQIFRLLLENKSQEEIARELNISTRTVARYSQRIEKRYGQMQRQKTNNTLFTEAQLFKHRMLSLYKALENSVLSENTSGVEKAKCAEIEANIAIDVLKMESEGTYKVVKDALIAEKEATRRSLSSAISSSSRSNSDDMMYDELEKRCR
ncbi:MAG TPA: helix-turn-helix domain-containing protein [Nitrososphaeraceae archaeon]